MRLVGQAAQPHLDAASTQRDWPSRATALNEQSAAVEVLEREYGSLSRLAVGGAATVLACLAVASAGLAVALVVSEDTSASESAVVLVGGAVIAAGLGAVGWRLARAVVRAGRAVVDALVRWHRLPESVAADGRFVPPEQRRRSDAIGDADRRRIVTRDAILARTYVFRGPLLVRIIVSGLLIVVVLLAWGMSISGVVLAEDSFDYAAAATAGGVALVLTAALAYVLGGAYRVNAAHAARDPVSAALARVLGRAERRQP